MSPYVWSYGGSAARVLLQFGLAISLARLLGPEPFGLIAACLIITTLIQETWDLGTSNAMIRPERPEPGEILGVLVLQASIGGLVATVLGLLAQPLAALLNIPAAAEVLPWLALSLAITALGQTSGTLLRRDLAFRELHAIQFATLVIGQGVVALGMAAAGYGVWALVVGQIVQASLTAISMLALRPPPWARPRLPWRVLSRGAGFAGTALINWLMVNIDSLIVARTLGQTQLGEYNRFQYLTVNAAGTVAAPLQAVLFPHTACNTQDPAALLSRTIEAGRSLVLVGAPAIGCLVCMPNTAIEAIFGPAWSTHGTTLAWLAGAGAARALAALPPPILSGMGRPWSVFWTQAAAACYALSAFLIGWWCGADLAGLAAIVCSVWLVRGLLSYAALLHALRSPATPLLRGLLPAVIVGSATCLPALATVPLLPDATPLLRLAGAFVVAYVVWFALLFAMPRILAPAWLRRALASRLGPPPA